MNSDIIKHQKHSPKKEKTRSITYRLPVKLVEEIEAEAMNSNISHNVMARQILEKYIRWDRFANKIGIIPVPKKNSRYIRIRHECRRC